LTQAPTGDHGAGDLATLARRLLTQAPTGDHGAGGREKRRGISTKEKVEKEVENKVENKVEKKVEK